MTGRLSRKAVLGLPLLGFTACNNDDRPTPSTPASGSSVTTNEGGAIVDLGSLIPASRRGKDITEILQQVIDQLSREGGGTIQLPSGRLPTKAVTLRAGVTLEGHQDGSSALSKVGPSARWIRVPPESSGTGLRQLSLDASGLVSVASVLVAADAFDITRCVLGNSGQADAIGVDISGSARAVRLVDCTLEGHSIGVRLRDNVSEISITGNRFVQWRERGIQALGKPDRAPSRLIIESNTIAPQRPGGSVRQPIQFNGADEQPFRGVKIAGNTVRGLGTDYKDPARPGTADLISLHRCTDFEVVDNTCTDGGDVGITVSQQSTDGLVSRNTCLRNDSAGISIGSSTSKHSSNITVSDNTCLDNGQARFGTGTPSWACTGINVNGGVKIRIDDNRLGNTEPGSTQQYGISLTRASEITMEGNQFVGSLRSATWREAQARPGGL